jgi:hypothetical protein
MAERKPQNQDPRKRWRDKVAIVGFTASRNLAPWNDPEYEIWGMNALFLHPEVKRASRWFDLHRFDTIDTRRKEWYQKQFSGPIYLQEKEATVKSSIAFPKDEVEKYFNDDYFTSSVAWILALAIKLGYKEIHMYGIDMSAEHEYFGQRPCVEYWMGIAKGRGIKTYVPPVSDLTAATHQYGYGSDGGFRGRMKQRIKEINGRIAALDQQIGNMMAMKNKLVGARENSEWVYNNWGVVDRGSMEPDSPLTTVPGANGEVPEMPMIPAGLPLEIAAPSMDPVGIVAEAKVAEG